jgi:hypothetical protein
MSELGLGLSVGLVVTLQSVYTLYQGSRGL